MIITISTRGVKLNAREKMYLESVSKQLVNHFISVISLRWKFESDHSDCIVKCQLHSKSGYYRAQTKADNLKKAVDFVFDKITKQRRRKKELSKKVLRRNMIKPSTVQ